MALESATKISELVNTNPAGTDERSTLDDHVRMIKACLLGLLTQAGRNDIGLGPAALTGLAGQALKVNVGETAFDTAAFEPANANLQAHVASTSNPHSTTAAQVLPAQTGNGGKVLTTDGSTASWGLVGSHPESITKYTSSGNWTKVAGINFIFVEVSGAGGGGAYYYTSGTNNCDGGGGGAGGYAAKLIDVSALSPGATVAMTIGAGGTAGTVSTSDAGDGGTTSFGAYCSASGGKGGKANYAGALSLGGKGGIGSGGDVNLRGEAGKPGGPNYLNSDAYHGEISDFMGGQGGSTRFGPGGRTGSTSADRTPDANTGAGGGGSAYNSHIAADAVAGTGSSGCILVTEYK